MRPQLIDPATPLALQQTQLFATALSQIGRDTTIVDLGGAGQAVVIERSFARAVRLRLTSRGPVWRDDAVATDRVAALNDAPINLINAESEDDAVLRTAGFRQVMTTVTHAILPIHADPDHQMSQAHGKWRNAARQLDRGGMRITQTPLTPALLGWLLAVDRLQQQQKRFRALPGRLTRALVAAGPNDAHLFCASRGNTRHAAMLLLTHGTSATYHLGWTDTRGRQACAHHAMILSAARWLARKGVTQLDLGQIDTMSAPGLARFKIGTGARLRQLGGTWLRLRPWR